MQHADVGPLTLISGLFLFCPVLIVFLPPPFFLSPACSGARMYGFRVRGIYILFRRGSGQIHLNAPGQEKSFSGYKLTGRRRGSDGGKGFSGANKQPAQVSREYIYIEGQSEQTLLRSISLPGHYIIQPSRHGCTKSVLYCVLW